MYRIELSPGEETVFRSIEELAVAIKRGVVTPRARIYHNASSKWLPIQFHPHYKAALSMPLTQSALVAGAPVKPLSTLSLQEAVPIDPPLPPAAMSKPVEPPAPVARKQKAAKQKPAGEKRARREAKPRRQLRIALVGALLLGGAQWVLSAPLFSRDEVAAAFRTHRRLIAAPANTAAMVPVISADEPAAAASFGGAANTIPAPSSPLPQVSSGAQANIESGATDQVEPIPTPIDVSVPRAPAPDSLLPRKASDSASQKAIRGIFRAVTGSSTKDRAAPKR